MFQNVTIYIFLICIGKQKQGIAGQDFFLTRGPSKQKGSGTSFFSLSFLLFALGTTVEANWEVSFAFGIAEVI